MFAALMALSAATSYGAADFLGGLASRRANPIKVTAIALTFGLIFLSVVSIFVRPEFSNQTILFGIYAGLCSGIALTLFYAALALGPISIVSPLTAVVGAVVPVVFDLLLGESLGSFTILALVLIVIAIALVSFIPSKTIALPSLRAVLYAFGAGIGFAGIFVFLDQAPTDSGIAPLVVMRVVGVAMLGLAVLFLQLRSKSNPDYLPNSFPPKLLAMIAASAVLDVSANFFFLLGTREGSLAIVAVLTSLYPIGTVLLARVVLGEKLARVQLVGIGVALAGCALLAL